MACPAWGSQGTAHQGRPGLPLRSLPCRRLILLPRRDACCPRPLSGGSGRPGPTPPYPGAAASRSGRPSQRLPSASSPAPGSASPRRWPRPPWPQPRGIRSVGSCGWRALQGQAQAASGPPGRPSGPGMVQAIDWLPRAVQALAGLLSGIWVLGVPTSQSETRTGESGSAQPF